MTELRDRMEADRAARQRVKVRTAEVAIGNQMPVLYPAFHWLPYTMLVPALLDWSGQTNNAVRWGEFELEYGSHSWLDPEAVIR